MKIKKLLPVILLALVLIFFFLPDRSGSGDVVSSAQDIVSAVSDIAEDLADTVQPEETESVPAGSEAAPEDTVSAEEAPAEENASEHKEDRSALDPDGSYTTKEDVALYIRTYNRLPGNFVTKKEAQNAGWSGGSLEQYLPGKCIGGDRFGNKEGLLPDVKGRKWTECDINTLGAKSRGAERIVFSNDGLIYYTGDHYESFELLYD